MIPRDKGRRRRSSPNENAGGQADVRKSEQQNKLNSNYTTKLLAMRGGLR